MLLVGVYNLGFCAVDRRAREFLDWWWSHLSNECLYDPLSGLFVDQKWMDIGSTLFEAGNFRHSGYNVGVANLPERPLAWTTTATTSRPPVSVSAVPLPRLRLTAPETLSLASVTPGRSRCMTTARPSTL